MLSAVSLEVPSSLSLTHTSLLAGGVPSTLLLLSPSSLFIKRFAEGPLAQREREQIELKVSFRYIDKEQEQEAKVAVQLSPNL